MPSNWATMRSPSALPIVRFVRIDGYVGIFWDQFREQLEVALRQLSVEADWIDVAGALKPVGDIESMVEPFLCGDDPLFGTRFTGGLSDFFDIARLAAVVADSQADLTIVFGCGAAPSSGKARFCTSIFQRTSCSSVLVQVV